MSPRRRALTLVELLVVMGIAALLIATLLPALRAARLSARNALCASRLHELVAACAMYQLDHHAYPPIDQLAVLGEVVPHLIPYSLLNQLAPYLGYPELTNTTGLADLPPVVQCPFAEDFDQPKIRGPVPLPGGLVVNTGYQYTA